MYLYLLSVCLSIDLSWFFSLQTSNVKSVLSLFTNNFPTNHIKLVCGVECKVGESHISFF